MQSIFSNLFCRWQQRRGLSLCILQKLVLPFIDLVLVIIMPPPHRGHGRYRDPPVCRPSVCPMAQLPRL